MNNPVRLVMMSGALLTTAHAAHATDCLLYTSDAADEMD